MNGKAHYRNLVCIGENSSSHTNLMCFPSKTPTRLEVTKKLIWKIACKYKGTKQFKTINKIIIIMMR